MGRLGDDHPEWRPWLALLDAVQSEAEAPFYDDAVPPQPVAPPGAPLLHDAVVTLPRGPTDRWVRRLLTAAAAAGGPAASLAAAARGSLDAGAVIEAAIVADRERLEAVARAIGADGPALSAVASLAAMPLLRACARRWSARAAGTSAGHCPICGGWPVFAEARGLERARRLRCGRCASDWQTEWLRCPYCATRDHLRLGSLVPEATAETRKVDTCAVCRRYVKTITTLGPTPAAEVGLRDLETVDLDVAALAHGFVQAEGLGHAMAVRIETRRARSLPGLR